MGSFIFLMFFYLAGLFFSFPLTIIITSLFDAFLINRYLRSKSSQLTSIPDHREIFSSTLFSNVVFLSPLLVLPISFIIMIILFPLIPVLLILFAALKIKILYSRFKIFLPSSLHKNLLKNIIVFSILGFFIILISLWSLTFTGLIIIEALPFIEANTTGVRF